MWSSGTCQYNMHTAPWSSGEYNSNNAWFYNGNNGRLNNNNKYYSFSVRPVLALYKEEDRLADGYVIPYEDIYNASVTCRKRKSRKPSYLYFIYKRREELVDLWHEINSRTLTFRESIAFVITKPKIREVIAADFRDRVAQTYLVNELLPSFEKYELPNSYSCRIGKGGLKAAKDFQEMVRRVSKNYTEDCYLFSLDFKSFFPSTDIVFWTPKLIEWIDHNYDGSNKEILKYLAESIYLHRPQENCKRKCHDGLWFLVDVEKSMILSNGYIGIPIGNVTSQTLANFITTPVLMFLRDHGIDVVCYTDDIKGVVKDKEKFLKLLPELRRFCWDECHLTLHPKKFDIQHFSKGIRVGGFKLRYDRILPNNRIYHNFIFKMRHFANILSQDEARNAFRFLNKVVSVANSYLGMMKHCNAYRLRKKGVDILKESPWKNYLDFPDKFLKIQIKEKYKPLSIQQRKYRERLRLKKQIIEEIESNIGIR